MCGAKPPQWEIKDINNMPMITCLDPDDCELRDPASADPSPAADPDPVEAEPPAEAMPPDPPAPVDPEPVDPEPAPARGRRARA